MYSTPMSSVLASERRRLSTSAWSETSSIDAGSSQMRNSGSMTSARAMATRWRWPPESSFGYLSR